jgi:hypothetical protein
MKSKITLEALRANGKRILSPVLAEGEVTGHAHRLVTMEGVERYEMEAKRYLVVTTEGGVSIGHEEHGTAVIEPGIYEERIDREYDYAAELARNVAD